MSSSNADWTLKTGAEAGLKDCCVEPNSQTFRLFLIMPKNKMHWPALLNWNRLEEWRRWKIDPKRSPWQVDYDRIIFSSVFRRLQDKTQVFPLSDSDYVRTRLTHSLEVSTVARTLGTRAGEIILEKHKADKVVNETLDEDGRSREVRNLKPLLTPADIGAILAAAALSHDLGNPPFGHSGEEAVRHWFKTSDLLKKVRKKLSSAQRADFEHWEGNAQGFRILTNLQLYAKEGKDGGMRLTHSVLGAFCKYTVFSRAMAPKSKRASQHKLGIFQSETAEFKKVARACGLLRNRQAGKNGWVRHPLTFLLEAADDICYRIIDLEDAVRADCISLEAAKSILERIATKMEPTRLDKLSSKTDKIAALRASVLHALIDEVVAAFAKHEPEMLTGKFDEALTTRIKSAPLLEEIKELMGRHVYSNRRVLEVEAAGFQIIPGLLDFFWCAVTYGSKKAGKSRTQRASKILALIPPEFRGPPGNSREAIYQRMMLIVDYVSGMTDSYALSVFRKLHGIALPH